MRHLARQAFSLVELLVVIGIIALLIGILLPVVGKMKASAYAASTSQSISTLQAAIQQYWGNFQAYPGPTGSAGGFGAPFTPAGSLINFSSSEELVLSLQGGIKVDFVANTLTFVTTDVGRGTVSLNRLNPKRYTAFGGGPTQDFNGNDIPEFRDAYPEPMPIHYVRAVTAGTTIPFNRANSIGEGPMYYPTPFGFKMQDGTDSDAADDFTDFNAYLRDPSNTALLRNKDSYVLIAAGKDRKFGTKDDITNFGTPGE